MEKQSEHHCTCSPTQGPTVAHLKGRTRLSKPHRWKPVVGVLPRAGFNSTTPITSPDFYTHELEMTVKYTSTYCCLLPLQLVSVVLQLLQVQLRWEFLQSHTHTHTHTHTQKNTAILVVYNISYIRCLQTRRASVCPSYCCTAACLLLCVVQVTAECVRQENNPTRTRLYARSGAQAHSRRFSYLERANLHSWAS